MIERGTWTNAKGSSDVAKIVAMLKRMRFRSPVFIRDNDGNYGNLELHASKKVLNALAREAKRTMAPGEHKQD